MRHNRAHEPDSEQEYAVQMLMLAVAEGRSSEADAGALGEFAACDPDLPMWQALAAYADCVHGDLEAARERFESLARNDFRAPVRDPDAIATLSFAAETCAALGDGRRAAVLHDLLLPHRDRNVVVERGWGAWGAAAYQLGVLAAAAGDRPRAAGYLERAVELGRRWGAHPWVERALATARELEGGA